MFKMQDEQGIDDKIICVPLRDPNWNAYERLDDLPELLRAEIEQLFSIYKDLENKRVVVDGWFPAKTPSKKLAQRVDASPRDSRPTPSVTTAPRADGFQAPKGANDARADHSRSESSSKSSTNVNT